MKRRRIKDGNPPERYQPATSDNNRESYVLCCWLNNKRNRLLYAFLSVNKLPNYRQKVF